MENNISDSLIIQNPDSKFHQGISKYKIAKKLENVKLHPEKCFI